MSEQDNRAAVPDERSPLGSSLRQMKMFDWVARLCRRHGTLRRWLRCLLWQFEQYRRWEEWDPEPLWEDGSGRYWAYNFRSEFAAEAFYEAPELARLCEAIGAFGRVMRARPIDCEGDPNYRSFRQPLLELDRVRLYGEILREKRRSGLCRELDPQFGGFLLPNADLGGGERGAVLFLSSRGADNLRILFEEAAHAHKRMTKQDPITGRSREWKRYWCHLDIFSALRASDLFDRLLDEDKQRIERRLKALPRQCRLRDAYDIRRQDCGCNEA